MCVRLCEEIEVLNTSYSYGVVICSAMRKELSLILPVVARLSVLALNPVMGSVGCNTLDFYYITVWMLGVNLSILSYIFKKFKPLSVVI